MTSHCFSFEMTFENCSSRDPFCLKAFPKYDTVGCFSPGFDYFLASVLVICALIGCPGNVLSAQFFAAKTRKDLVTRLYITICVVDSVSCAFNLPVAVSLYAGRRPLWFTYQSLCLLWESISLFQTRLSIFLVLMLSVTRTIAIVKPFYKMRGLGVLVGVVGYITFLLGVLLFAVSNPTTRERFRYSWDGVYCYYNYNYAWEHTVNAIQIGLPPVLISISLVVSIIRLHISTKMSASRQRCSSAPGNQKEMGRFQASVTIAMFTGLFLLCNVPLFTNLIHNLGSTFFSVDYPGAFFGSPFMFWYSWHIAKVQCMVWNAALNPVLYYCRMKRLRRWVNNIFTSSKVRAAVDEFYAETLTNIHPQPGKLWRNTELISLSRSPGIPVRKLANKGGTSPIGGRASKATVDRCVETFREISEEKQTAEDTGL